MAGIPGFKSKLQALWPDHSGQVKDNLPHLLLLIISLATAKAIFRLFLLMLLVAFGAVWLYSRGETEGFTSPINPVPAESSPQDAETGAMALETKRIVDEAHREAEQTYQTALKRHKEAIVKGAAGAVSTAEYLFEAHNRRFTDKYEDLHKYGWRNNPDLIYEDIKLGQTPEGNPKYTVIVRHREKDIKPCGFDSSKGYITDIE